jgi:hypothetical protein
MKVYKKVRAKIKTYLKGLKKPVIRIDLPNSLQGEKWVRVLADYPFNRNDSHLRRK